ncbi:MAG: ATP-dependent Clp protease proteolytic subunit [Desulfurococcales archaeon]|nr:ATP-dependent Clp protease proteolytic subunit [Desulfurococcales archaeon]MEB3758471.1 ATP-dependent Clp protease proteolytic subunit [Desulfurococcales archaeon]MEB3799525.1 ATP-dependent Clp protease proteolytic subunit [Desulfurococcales archaeon]
MSPDLLNSIIWMLFWLLFLIPLLSPTYSYQRLKSARMRLLQLLEKKYGFRFITLIHRQEKIGLLGIPLYRFIDIDDSEAVIRAIRQTPRDQPIALVLHTPGGLVLAAAQIAMALKRHPAKKVVIVPHYAMSGGTLIALAADEIWMDPNAVLGPLDPQLAIDQTFHAPAPSIIKVAKEKGKDASDKILLMADVAEKALKEVQEFIQNLVKDKLGEEKAKELAKLLTEGRWTHDYPITFEEAKKLGLNVKDEIPVEIYQFMELFPQAPMNRPGVEYIPHPLIPYRHNRSSQS